MTDTIGLTITATVRIKAREKVEQMGNSNLQDIKNGFHYLKANRFIKRLIGLGTAPIFLIYLICNTCIGITAPCYNAPITVTIQERVPSEMQGRMFSFMQMVNLVVAF